MPWCALLVSLSGLLPCGLVVLPIPSMPRYPFFLIFSVSYSPFQVHGGGEVALEQLRLALNQMAEARVGQGSADEPDDNQDYPDNDSDDHDGGPLALTDWPGLFSNDVSCLILL